ncbi:hypothetical protein AB1Y20_000577 [Prymnesium parvum]|uniref:Uncharacterized protein n=1 Tax=Prymnesium parvum TaxID=97485 RepID=A0AB34K5Q1_PRYPA
MAAPPSDAAAQWLMHVRRGSYKGVKEAIRDGWAPVNATDDAGFTALMRCCVSGQMLELVLGCEGCDVNHSAAPDGSTPLLLAARHRSVRTVHTLLRRGARFSRDAKGATVLHKAAANPDPAVAKMLLESDADPFARDSEGRFPLGAALLQANEQVALLLLRWYHTCTISSPSHAIGHTPPTPQAPASAPSTIAAGEGGATPAVTLDSLDGDCLDALIAFGDCYRDFASVGRRRRSTTRETGDSSRGRGGGGGIRVFVGQPSGSHESGGAAASEDSDHTMADATADGGDSFALAMVSKRYRHACQRRAAVLCLSKEAMNAPIARYHPAGATASPLHFAAAHGMEEVAHVMMVLGSKIGAHDSSGQTPIDEARRNGRGSMVSLLLSVQAERDLTLNDLSRASLF